MPCARGGGGYARGVRSMSSLALAAIVAGCATRGASLPSDAQPAIDYAVTPPAPGSWTVQVEARVERSPSDRLVAPEADRAVTHVVQVDGSSVAPLPREGDTWLAPACRKRCTLRY